LAINVAPFCDTNTYQLIFDFYNKELVGQKEPKLKWKRVLGHIDELLGEILSKVYIQKYFSEEQKTSCLNMINEIYITYQERINNLDWMTEETKIKALEKTKTFVSKIGYPDKWADFSKLEIDESLSFLENILKCLKWFTAYNLKDLYKQVDKKQWFLKAHTINACYCCENNDITFPACILQEPFYSINQSIGENLGGIGAVVAHEMTHGFDDQGSQFDGDGNLKNWWSDEDRKNFDHLTGKLVDQFNGFHVVDDTYVNGQLTLG
jgi:putative endopeptidase